MNYNSQKASQGKGSGIRGSFLTNQKGPVYEATRQTEKDFQPEFNSGIYESTDFAEGKEERRSTANNKFAKTKKNELYESINSTDKARRNSVLTKKVTNTAENDKACCKDGGCLVF